MPDLIYKGTAYGDVVIYEAWPDKLKQDWINALVATGYKFPDPPFTPTYDTGSVFWMDNEGHLQMAPLDRYQLASAETAEALRVRYKGTEVKTLPFLGGGGPMVSAAQVRYIRWSGVADHAVRSMMTAAGIP